MKLDTKSLRYLSADDWRVLTAVESGTRTHEVVPTKLIAQLSGVRGDVARNISLLAKTNLIARVKNARYDGYRLTYGGLDYLALHALQKVGAVYSVGNRIGVGKESDIFVVAHAGSGGGGGGGGSSQRVLKIHRLGRISFRSVKKNRDYLRKKGSGGGGSWMYMSRLAALKEFTFMKALRATGAVEVPEPLAQNRHHIVMSLVNGFPLRQIESVPDPGVLYAELMEMLLRLAGMGLIHGDFNEFNILIREDEAVVDEKQEGGEEGEDGEERQQQERQQQGEGEVEEEEEGKEVERESKPKAKAAEVKLVPVLIDFPQMVSVDHENAEFYFARDVECVKRFFQRRFGFVSDEPGPFFRDAQARLREAGGKRLDVEAEASGFSKKMAKELEKYMKEHGVDGDAEAGGNRADEQADEAEEMEDAEDDDDGESGGDAQTDEVQEATTHDAQETGGARSRGE